MLFPICLISSLLIVFVVLFLHLGPSRDRLFVELKSEVFLLSLFFCLVFLDREVLFLFLEDFFFLELFLALGLKFLLFSVFESVFLRLLEVALFGLDFVNYAQALLLELIGLPCLALKRQKRHKVLT